MRDEIGCPRQKGAKEAKTRSIKGAGKGKEGGIRAARNGKEGKMERIFARVRHE